MQKENENAVNRCRGGRRKPSRGKPQAEFSLKNANTAQTAKTVKTAKTAKTAHTANTAKTANTTHTAHTARAAVAADTALRSVKSSGRRPSKGTPASKGTLSSKSTLALKGTPSQKLIPSRSTPSSKGAKQGRAQGSFCLPVRLSFLGGLNEIGKNMTLYEYDGEMFLVDCGLAFPDSDMPGVDLVIPDFTYVQRNADKIKGIFITHGHEDHIGGLAFLLKVINIPVYATSFTLGLIRGKLREHGILEQCELREIKAGDTIRLGKFSVETVHVNHSIPDSLALVVRCEAGVIVQTGDFKIDTTPIDGKMIDLARFAQIGNEGVLCYLADSTNAEKPGFSASEKTVGQSFETLFRKAGNRRIIVATFASNIHRIQQIINEAVSQHRKVALSGRSLENVVSVGQELNYLDVPDGVMISLDELKNYTPEQLLLITTGSQGEPMSALSRMASGDHRKVSITPNDYIIISATPIPGNEKMVTKVVNELMRQGAEVVYEKMYDVHVSGHAYQEELKLMLGLIKPRYFIPVHGEQRHLKKHALLATEMGIASKNILISDIGKSVELSEASMHEAGTVPAGRVFVDGKGVGDVGSVVIRDRTRLAEDGIIAVVLTLDRASGIVLSGPDIVSRGFVYVREAEELINELRELAVRTLDGFSENELKDRALIKSGLRDEISKRVYGKTNRNPMILPIIMEV